MTAIPQHPQQPAKAPKSAGARATSTERTPGDNLLPELAHRFTTGSADCCIARAAYRIVFRTAGHDARTAELYLCGHHYRASTACLLEVQAAVYDEQQRLLASFI